MKGKQQAGTDGNETESAIESGGEEKRRKESQDNKKEEEERKKAQKIEEDKQEERRKKRRDRDARRKKRIEQEHERERMQANTTYSCRICTVLFSEADRLQAHARQVHLNKKQNRKDS